MLIRERGDAKPERRSERFSAVTGCNPGARLPPVLSGSPLAVVLAEIPGAALAGDDDDDDATNTEANSAAMTIPAACQVGRFFSNVLVLIVEPRSHTQLSAIGRRATRQW